MTEGVLYVATDKERIQDTILSARATKQQVNLPITVVADRMFESEFIDNVIVDSDPKYSFDDKVRNLERSPYNKTLYMDTDVYLLDSISEIFEILDEYDIATAIDQNEWELRVDKKHEFEKIPECFPLYQTGVIAYKTDHIHDFLQRWNRIQHGNAIKRDQVSFRIALWESSVRHTSLPKNYNCFVGWPMQITGEAKIVHDSDYISNLSDLSLISRRMNSSHAPRLFFTPRGESYAPISGLFNFLFSILSRVLTMLFNYYLILHRKLM